MMRPMASGEIALFGKIIRKDLDDRHPTKMKKLCVVQHCLHS
jgi:hypothetical protein